MKKNFTYAYGIRAAIAVFVLVAAFFLCLRPGFTEYDLVIELKDTGDTWSFTVPEGEFTLGYTHSVMKTPVEETFSIDGSGRIHLVETIYQSYGVGLPFLPEEGDYRTEDGRFILSVHREIGELSMSISPIPNHWLSVGETTYYFNDLLGEDGGSIVVYAEKRLFKLFRAG